MIRGMMLAGAMLSLSLPAWAGKNCDELKAEVQAKIQQKGVARFTLDIVATGTVKPEDKVVGRCEAGAKQLVYKRG